MWTTLEPIRCLPFYLLDEDEERLRRRPFCVRITEAAKRLEVPIERLVSGMQIRKNRTKRQSDCKLLRINISEAEMWMMCLHRDDVYLRICQSIKTEINQLETNPSCSTPRPPPRATPSAVHNYCDRYRGLPTANRTMCVRARRMFVRTVFQMRLEIISSRGNQHVLIGMQFVLCWAVSPEHGRTDIHTHIHADRHT